jgi:putative transposase
MARREVTFLPEQFYHIYNRGNNRQSVFLGDENYSFFLRRLDHYFTPVHAEIAAYCLMPNYFHLLIRLSKEISKRSSSKPTGTSATSVGISTSTLLLPGLSKRRRIGSIPISVNGLPSHVLHHPPKAESGICISARPRNTRGL